MYLIDNLSYNDSSSSTQEKIPIESMLVIFLQHGGSTNFPIPMLSNEPISHHSCKGGYGPRQSTAVSAHSNSRSTVTLYSTRAAKTGQGERRLIRIYTVCLQEFLSKIQ